MHLHNCTNVASVGNQRDANGADESGPDYKDQCQPSSYRTTSSATDSTTPTSEIAARRSVEPTNVSSDHSFHIPFVCGVPLPDETNAAVDESLQTSMSVPRTIQFEALQQRQRNEMVLSETDSCPERALPTSDSASSRKSSRSSHSSLTQEERKYWIRVITCAVIVNTLLVLAVVVGGLCGTTNCRFSTSRSPTDISLENTTDSSVGGNRIDAPTPSPSQRRASSFAPTAEFAPPIPSRVSESLSPSAYAGEVFQPADPAFGPLQDLLAPSLSPLPISQSPSINFSKPEDYPGSPKTAGFALVLLIPIAVLVDVALVICYLFFHYKRWIKARNASGDGSMTSSDEMHSLRSRYG